MTKEKYYVSIASSEISQVRYGNNDGYTIYATDEEVRLLRAKMDNMHEADRGTYWRAHIPFMSYHHDQTNDHYDSQLSDAFQMIHDLGNEEARTHIVSMGILGDPNI